MDDDQSLARKVALQDVELAHPCISMGSQTNRVRVIHLLAAFDNLQDTFPISHPLRLWAVFGMISC